MLSPAKSILLQCSLVLSQGLLKLEFMTIHKICNLIQHFLPQDLLEKVHF